MRCLHAAQFACNALDRSAMGIPQKRNQLSSAKPYLFFGLAVVACIVLDNLVNCFSRDNSILLAAQSPHHRGDTIQKAIHICFPSLSSEYNVNVLLRFQSRILL